MSNTKIWERDQIPPTVVTHNPALQSRSFTAGYRVDARLSCIAIVMYAEGFDEEIEEEEDEDEEVAPADR